MDSDGSARADWSLIPEPRSPAPGFGYLRDPLFLGSLGLYCANRFWLKSLTSHEFFHSYLNDLVCIPVWVPIMLWMLRTVGLRPDDGPPSWLEIAVPLIVWSLVFETLLPQLPHFRGVAFADPWDVVAYAAGATVGALFWSRGNQLTLGKQPQAHHDPSK